MIITHSAKGHFDDFLSITLASYITKDICIKRIKHSEVQDTIKNMTKEDIMVDIGGTLNFKKHIFDHHHNKLLNASFVYVAKHFNINLPKNNLWEYFSDVDTKGPEKASKIHSINNIKTDIIYNTVQPVLKTWDIVLPEGTINTKLFIKIGDYLNKKDFILNLYTLTNIRNTVKNFYPEQFLKAVKQLTEKEKQKEKIIKTLKHIKIGNYLVAIHKSTLYLSHKDTKTPVILTINQRTNKPCLIVDTEILHVSGILKLLGNPDTLFVHINGFLAVIDDTWDNTIKRFKNYENFK